MNYGFDAKQMVFYNMAFHENNAWFCHVYYNALCKLDLDSDEITIEALFPTDDGVFGKYGDILYNNEKLILMPRNSTTILTYDLKTGEFTSIALSREYMYDDVNFNLFTKSFIYKKFAFFIPGTYKAIVKMDLVTSEITYYDKWHNDLEPYIKNKKRVVFLSNSQVDGDIFLPFCQGNKIVKFSLDDGETMIVEVGDNSLELMDIITEGEIHWLSDRNEKNIYKWNTKTNELSIINNYPQKFQTKYGGIHSIKKYNDDIYIFPLCGNMIVKFNTQSLKMTKFMDLKMELAPEIENFTIADNNFLEFSEYDKDKIYMYSIFDGMIYCIDFSNQSIKKIKSRLENMSDDLEKKIFISMHSSKESRKFIMQETEDINLNLFIEIIKKSN